LAWIPCGDENMGLEYREEHQRNVQKWLKEDTFKSIMRVTLRIETTVIPIALLASVNVGKAVLHAMGRISGS
jgi:hypothetical protein